MSGKKRKYSAHGCQLTRDAFGIRYREGEVPCGLAGGLEGIAVAVLEKKKKTQLDFPEGKE